MNFSSDAKIVDTYGGHTLINNPIHDDEGFDKNSFEVWFEDEYIDTIKGFTYDNDYDNAIQSFRNWVDYYKKVRK